MCKHCEKIKENMSNGKQWEQEEIQQVLIAAIGDALLQAEIAPVQQNQLHLVMSLLKLAAGLCDHVTFPVFIEACTKAFNDTNNRHCEVKCMMVPIPPKEKSETPIKN
jgi:hypothetical protein